MTHSKVREDEALELAILEGMADEDAPAKVREYVDSDRMIDRLRVGEAHGAAQGGHVADGGVRELARRVANH